MAEDFLKRRILTLRDLGAMEVCSSNEMGAPGASHLGAGDHGPKTDRSRPRSVPINAPAFANHFDGLSPNCTCAAQVPIQRRMFGARRATPTSWSRFSSTCCAT